VTTETAPAISREILEERWHMASTRAIQFEGEPGPTEGNSKAIERLTDALHELASRMTHGDIGSERFATLYEDTHFRVMAFLEEELYRLVADLEERRVSGS
jgi:hypothetical protein